MKKMTFVTLGLSGILALNGCSSLGTDTQTISGKAIDPYLAGATVCLADDDRVCLSDEANVTTDGQGNYTLIVSGEHFGQSHRIVATGGRDIETDALFTGSVVSIHEANATGTLNITPLTTWLSAEFDELNATTQEARAQIEAALETRYHLNFHADVVAEAEEGNTTGFKVAVKLARSAELYDANHTFGFYVYVARQHDAVSTDERIQHAATQAEEETGGTGLRHGVDEVIDAVNNAQNTVQGIARSAQDVAQDVAGQIHGFVHETVCDFTGTCDNDQHHTGV